MKPIRQTTKPDTANWLQVAAIVTLTPLLIVLLACIFAASFGLVVEM